MIVSIVSPILISMIVSSIVPAMVNDYYPSMISITILIASIVAVYVYLSIKSCCICRHRSANRGEKKTECSKFNAEVFHFLFPRRELGSKRFSRLLSLNFRRH
jgi:hypothetical protein